MYFSHEKTIYLFQRHGILPCNYSDSHVPCATLSTFPYVTGQFTYSKV